MLSSLPLRISYRSGQDDVLEDFYRPCLEQAVIYRRAVGYFTSAGLAHAAKGLASLVVRGGKMRLVASPQLSDDDIEALSRAADEPEKVLGEIVARSLQDVTDLLACERLNALAWLAASGALEVKLAIRLNAQGQPARGIYHEKIGVFSDDAGNHVAFAGSANETEGGLVENFESIKVFWSWEDTQGRVKVEIDNFDALWENRTKGLRVLDFSKTSRELLKRYQLADAPGSSSVVREESGCVKVLNIKKPPRSYQDEAIDAWFTAGRQGILAMATGSGKTLTALHLVNRLASEGPLAVVITCPYVNLAEQWVRELNDAGVRPLKCYGAQAQWRAALEAAMSGLMVGSRKFVVAVVVNKTFLNSTFQQLLRPDRVPHLLIADEMHNLGAEQLRTKLNPQIRYRVGLSATPERHMDGDGTKALFDYFGNIVFTYDLAQAIKGGQLCRYHYHPVLVELNDEEAEEYLALSIEIGQLMRVEGCEDAPSLRLKMLLLRRARLLASAQAKLPALQATLADMGFSVSKALFYCGDGQVEVETEDSEGEAFETRIMKQMQALIQMLGREARLRVARFSHHESMKEREKLLVQLRDDRLDGLVAIRCLDEGIDLPDVRMGFILASSTNPRQFIQRRGRLLRRSDGKNRADIWDFIVCPPDLGGKMDDALFNLERRLFQRELARVLEFCQTAENGDAARQTLLDLRRRYNLLADSL